MSKFIAAIILMFSATFALANPLGNYNNYNKNEVTCPSVTDLIITGVKSIENIDGAFKFTLNPIIEKEYTWAAWTPNNISATSRDEAVMKLGKALLSDSTTPEAIQVASNLYQCVYFRQLDGQRNSVLIAQTTMHNNQ